MGRPMEPQRRGRMWLVVGLLAGASALAGCGGSAGTAGAGAQSDTFIAFAPDFAGWDQWIAFDLGDDQADGLGAVGVRRAYLNRLPQHGSAEFPVGTLVVKTIGEGTAAPGQTFAMAKRGGGFNALGTRGWEWFELDTAAPPASPVMVWRGISPPSGEMYAGIMGGACNGCHLPGTNDGVPSAELTLSAF